MVHLQNNMFFSFCLFHLMIEIKLKKIHPANANSPIIREIIHQLMHADF